MKRPNNLKVGDKFIVVDGGNYHFEIDAIVTLIADDGSNILKFSLPNSEGFYCDFSRLEPYIEAKKQNPPYSHLQARLKAYCKLNGVDADKVFDLLFKKPVEVKEDKPEEICKEFKRILLDDGKIPAIQYYRQQTNCSLKDAADYWKSVEDKPTFEVGEMVNVNPRFEGDACGISRSAISKYSYKPHKIVELIGTESTTYASLDERGGYSWNIEMLEKIPQQQSSQ